MRIGNRELFVVGDRVLIQLEQPEERTRVGLYLPQTVIEKEKVASGRIVAVGPGSPLPSLENVQDEHWKENVQEPKYIPMQAQVGDYALFLKSQAIEIQFQGDAYQVVAQSGILVLVRDVREAGWDDLPV